MAELCATCDREERVIVGPGNEEFRRSKADRSELPRERRSVRYALAFDCDEIVFLIEMSYLQRILPL